MQTAVSLNADDTSALSANKTWEDIEKTLDTLGDALEAYSHDNQLHINLAKTQKLLLGRSATNTAESLNILGVTLDKSGGFNTHHEITLNDLRRRLGMIRRLKCQISRGKLLHTIAGALFVGRLQCSAWITRPMRTTGEHCPNKGPAQVLTNDLARILLGITRADHYRTEDMMNKANLPTVNQIVVRQSALAAWRAANGGALEEVLQTHDSRTRGAGNNLRRPVSQRCTASANMARAWNSSQQLREAKTLSHARSIAKKMGIEARHA